jgi:hypothetical protein
MSEPFFTNALTAAVPPLPDTLRLPTDTAGGPSEAVTTLQLKAYCLGLAGQYAAAANTTSFVASAAQVAGSMLSVLDLTGTLGAGATVTTPSAATILAALPWVLTGSSWVLRILNNSAAAFTWTLVGGTGVTVVGTATVAQATWREWLATVTGGSALTVQNVGAGDAG